MYLIGMQRICILGPGRMGGALAIALAEASTDLSITQLIARRSLEAAEAIASRIEPRPEVVLSDEINSIEADIVLITTGDPEIRSASEWLSKRVKTSTVVLHTSGSLASTELSACAEMGCPTGSVHPLVPISEPVSGSKLFRAAYFCVEGDSVAQTVAEKVVSSLGGNKISIDTALKPLYHAAAVTSAGHVVALFSIAIEMLSKCGVDLKDAKKILLPLTQRAVENLCTQTPETAVTGSFARLDTASLDRHLASFEGKLPPEFVALFLLLGERSVDLAEQAGGNHYMAVTMRNRINMAKSKLEC